MRGRYGHTSAKEWPQTCSTRSVKCMQRWEGSKAVNNSTKGKGLYTIVVPASTGKWNGCLLSDYLWRFKFTDVHEKTVLKECATDSGVPRGAGWGVWVLKPHPPEIPKAFQNRSKLNSIVKTVKKNLNEVILLCTYYIMLYYILPSTQLQVIEIAATCFDFNQSSFRRACEPLLVTMCN